MTARFRVGMVSVFVMSAAAISLAAAQLADAAIYRFEGDRGTVCTVEVGAKASDSLGGLTGPPQVGYSSVPQCSYASKPSAAEQAKRKRACRKAKKRGTKKGRRGCKRAKKPGRSPRTSAASPAAAGVTVPAPALLEQAQLELLGPGGGVTSVGMRTMSAPALGYSCAVTLTSACADSGRLLPAIPGVTYVAQFSLGLAPPPGERWIERPATGCSAGGVAECALGSAPVTPQL